MKKKPQPHPTNRTVWGKVEWLLSCTMRRKDGQMTIGLLNCRKIKVRSDLKEFHVDRINKISQFARRVFSQLPPSTKSLQLWPLTFLSFFSQSWDFVKKVFVFVCSCLTGSCVCVSWGTLVWWRPSESAVLDIPSATPSWSSSTATGCSCLESNRRTNR